MPTVTEVDQAPFGSTTLYVTVKGLYSQLRATHLYCLIVHLWSFIRCSETIRKEWKFNQWNYRKSFNSAFSMHAFIVMHMKYWATMKAPESTARIELTTIALPKADHLIFSLVHQWECIWLKKTTNVFTAFQQWKKLPQLFLLSIATETSVTSFSLWEAVVEMIFSVKDMILSSTISVSARRMLHTCAQIAYWYFVMEHMGVIMVCVSSFPSSLLLLQSLFLVLRWWFMTIVCHFSILIPSIL